MIVTATELHQKTTEVRKKLQHIGSVMFTLRDRPSLRSMPGEESIAPTDRLSDIARWLPRETEEDSEGAAQ